MPQSYSRLRPPAAQDVRRAQSSPPGGGSIPSPRRTLYQPTHPPGSWILAPGSSHRWAEVVAHFIKPGGALYQVESHPCSEVFDNPAGEGMPAYSIPYFTGEALRFDDPSDYASSRPLQNALRYEWMHPLGETITALLTEGLTLRWLHEHDSVAFQRYKVLIKDSKGMYRWPDKNWLPLSYSLRAERE